MNKYKSGCFKVNAIYTTPLQPLYKDNPLIEALPGNAPPEDIVRSLLRKIEYDNSQREYPSHERIDCIQGIFECFQPWSTHIELVQKLSNTIKSGYTSRNPLGKQHALQGQLIYQSVREKDPQFTAVQTSSLGNSKATGFSIIGYSGMGKTSAINSALSLFPQIIVHNDYKGSLFPHLQIIWMKLECPFDGSVKGLCTNFFAEFDRLTGDSTFHKHATGRTTTDIMIPQMAAIAHRHSLGVLVIDEIQRISAAKSGGLEKILNFLAQLVNTIGVPIILIGTPEAISVLSTDLMNARRNSGQQGTLLMDKLESDHPDWDIFCRGIWKYQWTSKKNPLTTELQKTLHEVSFGIVDVAVKVYATAQKWAIQAGHETITPELLKSVFKSDEFRLLKSRLDMLQNPKKGDFVHPDLSLLSWDKTRKQNDLAEVLPKRIIPFPSSRNEELQHAVAIPKNDANITESILDSEGESSEQKLVMAGKLVQPEDEF